MLARPRTSSTSRTHNRLFVKEDLKKCLFARPRKVTAGHALVMVEQRRNATNPGITDDRLGSLT